MSEGKPESTEPETHQPQAAMPSSPRRSSLNGREAPPRIATDALEVLGLKAGKTSAGDAAIILKILDDIDESKWRREQRNREEREDREERKSRSQANDGSKSKREEDPKIAKLEADMKTILEHLQAEDQDKHEKDLIERTTEKATKETNERMKGLEDKIASLTPSAATSSNGQKPKSELQLVKDSAQTIKETAAMMGMKDASSITPASASITSTGAVFEGIPVSGSIPAYLAAIPIVLEKVIDQIDKLATKYLGPLQKEEEEPMITLPPKPEPEAEPEPPHTPVQQKPEEEEEEMLEMPQKPEPPEPEPPHTTVTIEKIEVQQKMMPQKLEEKTEGEALALPEASNYKATTEVSSNQATGVSGSTPATFPLTVGPPEVPKIEKKADETVATTEKEYKCKYCGQGGFKRPVALASHSKKCPSHPRNQPKKESDPSKNETSNPEPSKATLSKAEEEDVAISQKEIQGGKSQSFKTADELIADLHKGDAKVS